MQTNYSISAANFFNASSIGPFIKVLHGRTAVFIVLIAFLMETLIVVQSPGGNYFQIRGNRRQLLLKGKLFLVWSGR
jgi:hypothetical protein